MSKAQKSDTDQRQFWQMAVETFKSSGLSIRQFCEKEGLSEASFYAWRKKMTPDGKCEDIKPDSGQIEPFIRVSMPSESASTLEFVLLSGNTLRIGSGADRQTLNDVITVLRQAGLC